MIERKYVEQILKVNGISPTAPDEEIREVLISSKWNKDDVETALTVLRENIKTHVSRSDTLHNVFQSDQRLSPEAIQSLLGIDVELSANELKNKRQKMRTVSFWQAIGIIGYATLLAFGSILIVMYVQNFGVFHPSL
jgi:hypothetical protein